MRMGLTLVCVPGLFLMNILLYCGHAQETSLSIDPNRSTFFTGESVTFTCDVRMGEPFNNPKLWDCSIIRNGHKFLSNTLNKISISLTPEYSGEYQCVATCKIVSLIRIESNTISITVSDKPKPVLTVSPLWPSPGDSVTLTCRVEHPSAGWRFFWYQVVPKLESYSYELLPGSSTGTEEDSFIVHGQTHTAGYVCRAGRGDPLFYSSYSEPQFIWSGDFHPAASLTVSPPRMQFFSKDSLSLSCEGNSTEWRVRRFIKYDHLAYCSSWGTMTGSTCSINSNGISGVYWCESETGQFSNAANITVQSGDVILVSSVHPVTEGHSVTLSCRLRTEKVLYSVDFYKNGKLISNDASGELFISEVTKSDEGFYKCEGRDSSQGFRSLKSPKSWLSVKSATTSSPVPVLLVVGLVCGVSLIILLLLVLYCYRKSKDSRLVRSQSTNQSPATDHMTNQVETQNNAYASLLHGDSCLYETIRGSEEPGHDIWLSTDPNRSTFFTGESVTFTCDVRTGEETGWLYSFRRNGVNFLFYSTDKIIRSPPVTPGFTEKYQCYATHKRSSAVFIESNKVSLTVTDKPKPVLTVSPLWPSPGDSVTLTCRVEHPSAGWRFFWYQVVPKLPYSYSYELLPGSSTGTEEDSFIVHGQTHTAGYVCRAGRGDPLFYSSYSEPQFIWSGDFHPAASLTVSPPRMQFFSKESLSLSCEGNSPEWRVRRFIKYVHLAYCSSLGTMTGSTCSINSIGISGVYWCESETGQFSNAANITVQSGDVILVSSVHPVTEGHSVTLSCRLRTEKVLYKVDFYKNDKLISNDASGELFISEVTKSDEGFYKCEGRDSPQGFRSLTSPESWLSVKSATTSSPVPVLLIVGLVCGVSLIILLLLVLYCYRKSKGLRAPIRAQLQTT
ncbi:uncharacterized protein LOC117747831 [Cyclopterus lumpus]|uniref:uncharacterized protein LOC117747831 n=1 Tax=Cyclopterus lumpus TaxID=8103 RepID=UPI001486CF55|nr:uncharacterized protein LOC117747831 [Cyclopterus lumpus]